LLKRYVGEAYVTLLARTTIEHYMWVGSSVLLTMLLNRFSILGVVLFVVLLMPLINRFSVGSVVLFHILFKSFSILGVVLLHLLLDLFSVLGVVLLRVLLPTSFAPVMQPVFSALIFMKAFNS
jgi:hypothetical protein